MIISFLLYLFVSFLSLLLTVLPVGGLPPEFSASIANIWGYVNAFSYVIALDTLIQVLVLYIAFDLVVLLWHVVQWIIRKVPGMQ